MPAMLTVKILGKSGEPPRNRTENPQIKSRGPSSEILKRLSNSLGPLCRTCQPKADRRNPGATESRIQPILVPMKYLTKRRFNYRVCGVLVANPATICPSTFVDLPCKIFFLRVRGPL